VKFSTDDGQFGVVVSPRPGDGRLFAFRLVIGGCVVGDDEPFILGSITAELQHRPSFAGSELPDVRTSPADAVDLLLDEERRLQDERFEAAMLKGAESLDGWLVWLYAGEAHGVALAQAVEDNERSGPVLVSRVAVSDFRALLASAVRYWQELSSTPDLATAASPGVDRHRLHRGGDRQANSAFGPTNGRYRPVQVTTNCPSK
jgi:hypothetical protein